MFLRPSITSCVCVIRTCSCFTKIETSGLSLAIRTFTSLIEDEDDWETDDYEVEEETYLYRGSCELNNLPVIKAIAQIINRNEQKATEREIYNEVSNFLKSNI